MVPREALLGQARRRRGEPVPRHARDVVRSGEGQGGEVRRGVRDLRVRPPHQRGPDQEAVPLLRVRATVNHSHSSPDRRTFLHASAGAAALTATSYERVLGANDRIGVGFVGYGLIAKTHVGTFAKLADADLVALAEVHKGRREEGLARLAKDATGYADFRKLLEDKRVNAVVVATPDHWHALVTMLACAAGKDVYVEKPLTVFVREGEWMQTVASRTKRVVQVGTQQRSGPHYAAARELIRSGKLGRIHSVRMSAVRNASPGFGNPPDQEPPADLDYDVWLGPAPARKYNPNRGLYHFRSEEHTSELQSLR